VGAGGVVAVETVLKLPQAARKSKGERTGGTPTATSTIKETFRLVAACFLSGPFERARERRMACTRAVCITVHGVSDVTSEHFHQDEILAVPF
jgi:hypothetical protein